jgi:thiamine pyrophosphate-dependent acetolactate synthase large subunit-like protein
MDRLLGHGGQIHSPAPPMTDPLPYDPLSIIVLIDNHGSASSWPRWAGDCGAQNRWRRALHLSRAEDARQINPDFVVYAKSYGIKGARVESADGLVPALEAAFAARGVQLVAAPIDYSENLRVLVDELPANAAKNGEQS